MARRLQGIEMSGIRKMFELAGSDSINMGLGEPDFEPAPHVQKALCDAVAAGQNHYGPSLGLPSLREAVADRIRDKWKEMWAPDREPYIFTGNMIKFPSQFLVLGVFYPRQLTGVR